MGGANMNEKLPGGGVTIFGRDGRLLGSPDSGVAFNDALATERLVILPSEPEWVDFA
jgi:hypothetical protein